MYFFELGDVDGYFPGFSWNILWPGDHANLGTLTYVLFHGKLDI